MGQRISIDPLTRLEGHGRVDIFLDDEGEVDNAYLIVPELRGFEQLCIGRPAEEMPRITSRICGLCPEAHNLASVKALDAAYGVEPPAPARKLRELFYSAFFVLDHATHFFALAGPDLLVGPEAPVSERSFLGVIRKLGDGVGRRIIEARSRNNEVLKLLGGRAIHAVAALPGGWSRPLSEPARQEIEKAARANVEFGEFCLQLFEDLVLGNQETAALIASESSADRTYYMGTVDEANRPNFYDGLVRVVDPNGREVAKYHPRDYLKHIAERVEPWTYLKLPYLKNVGWKGLSEGAGSGLYVATPLSRLNVADAMATPRAQESFERMFETLGSKTVDGRREPIHYRLATHWARLIELLAAAERMLELALDPEITDPQVRVAIRSTPVGGVGSLEAPRGTLTHDYRIDDDGIITGVNLIVGTTNNHAPIALSIRKAARSLISKGVVVTEGLLNRIEMVVRSYDPCLSCATHSTGAPALEVTIRDPSGRVLKRLGRGGGGGGRDAETHPS